MQTGYPTSMLSFQLVQLLTLLKVSPAMLQASSLSSSVQGVFKSLLQEGETQRCMPPRLGTISVPWVPHWVPGGIERIYLGSEQSLKEAETYLKRLFKILQMKDRFRQGKVRGRIIFSPYK